ncbi:MAG: tetratricopeptide repeat protein [Candidatus Omnitrophica bacterium]|nr:tetratricopeptide repeat protein [Candidatus Omnitrophota bacterium]
MRSLRASFKQKIFLIVLGVFLFFILLESSLRLGGFIILSIQEHRNYQSIKQKGAYRILCLGESTTQNQYPPFLEEILNQRNIGIHFSVIDKGLRGTNTPTILNNLESYLAQYHPDMVVAMMGINDRGDYIPLETSIDSKHPPFLKSLQTYKLARLLWLHIMNKAREAGLCKPDYPNDHLGIIEHKRKEVYVEFPLAEIPLKKTIQINPSDPSAYVHLGNLYRQQRKFSRAQELFKKALELDPQNDNAYAGLGRVYREQDKLVQAEELFKKALALDPGNSDAYLGLGWVYRDQGKFSRADALFKTAIHMDPEDDDVYIELGWFYLSRGESDKSEEAFKKAIQLNPQNNNAYAGLGRVYREQNKFFQAEDLLKKSIEFAPGNDNAYVELGKVYREQDKFTQAEEAFKKAIQLNPASDSAYTGLGWLYRDERKFSQVEYLFKKALELNPENDYAYAGLGWLYRDQLKFSQSEEAFKNAIQLNPKNDNAYTGLVRLYRHQGKIHQAEELFKKAIVSNPKNERAYRAILLLYREVGKPEQVQEYIEKAAESRLEYYNPVTVHNYRRLKDILSRQKIKLVCVQYPVRSVEPLKKIFPDDKGVIFVDNEKIFKEALKSASFNEYFKDIFGGEFGHGTDKANRLLAENIACTILKEVFSK